MKKFTSLLRKYLWIPLVAGLLLIIFSPTDRDCYTDRYSYNGYDDALLSEDGTPMPPPPPRWIDFGCDASAMYLG